MTCEPITTSFTLRTGRDFSDMVYRGTFVAAKIDPRNRRLIAKAAKTMKPWQLEDFVAKILRGEEGLLSLRKEAKKTWEAQCKVIDTLAQMGQLRRKDHADGFGNMVLSAEQTQVSFGSYSRTDANYRLRLVWPEAITWARLAEKMAMQACKEAGMQETEALNYSIGIGLAACIGSITPANIATILAVEIPARMQETADAEARKVARADYVVIHRREAMKRSRVRVIPSQMGEVAKYVTNIASNLANEKLYRDCGV